jgi:hypothetical protein
VTASVHCPYRSSGMIGYYSSKGVIHGLSHLAVLKIFLDSRCFLTYLNGDVYGFASTLHTVPTYVRGVIAKSADVSVVNTLRKVSGRCCKEGHVPRTPLPHKVTSEAVRVHAPVILALMQW